MPSSCTWWTSHEVFAALFGVALGFLLTLFAEWWRGRVRRRAHWAALNAEIEYCREMAETYLRDNIPAPLYRLPIVAYSNALPVLLASGALNEAETRNLISFFNEVETLNRGFDQVEGARFITDPAERNIRLTEEHGRNRLKAERLVPFNARSPSYYDSAKSVVESRLRWYKP